MKKLQSRQGNYFTFTRLIDMYEFKIFVRQTSLLDFQTSIHILNCLLILNKIHDCIATAKFIGTNAIYTNLSRFG